MRKTCFDHRAMSQRERCPTVVPRRSYRPLLTVFHSSLGSEHGVHNDTIEGGRLVRHNERMRRSKQHLSRFVRVLEPKVTETHPTDLTATEIDADQSCGRRFQSKGVRVYLADRSDEHEAHVAAPHVVTVGRRKHGFVLSVRRRQGLIDDARLVVTAGAQDYERGQKA